MSEPSALLQSMLALKRFIAREQPRGAQACEFCTQPIPDEHQHVVNVETRVLLCACRACYLLFAPEGAAQGKYRAVPERYIHAGNGVITASDWDEMQIPVGIAFFFFNSTLGRTVAFYPSPAGAIESLLPIGVWDQLVANNPVLADLSPDVEALLVRKQDDFDCYVVPIDACYELIGRMRRCWRGFDGGEEARGEIESFFAALADTERTGRNRAMEGR